MYVGFLKIDRFKICILNSYCIIFLTEQIGHNKSPIFAVFAAASYEECWKKRIITPIELSNCNVL